MKEILAKAYSTFWVQNIYNQVLIGNWFENGLLSKQQFEDCETEFPVGFKQTNIFIKIGLFIFTIILVFALIGFVSLFFSDLFKTSIALAILSILVAICLYFVLNSFIQKNKNYRNGIDNALIYCMIGALFLSICSLTDYKLSFLFYTIVLFVILLLATLKYADPLVTVGLFITFIIICFHLTLELSFGKLILPFVIMGVSAGAYFLIKYVQELDFEKYYFTALEILESMALACFYLAGNYGVVREGNAQINNISPSTQIAFAPLFYFFSVIIPIGYIVWAIKTKSRKMLIIGLLAIAFSIFTYRHYFSILPLEWALTLGGLVLVVLGILLIKFLKTPKFGVSSAEQVRHKFANLEAILVSEIIKTPGPPTGTKFGGGDFGGGGATGQY